MTIVRSTIMRGVALAAAWGILTRGDPRGLWFGAIVVALALVVGGQFAPPGHTTLRPLGLARFVAAFLYGSVRGGLDVARRALMPRPALAPTVITYASRLDDELARRVFGWALNLMPGTLILDRDGVRFDIHVLVDPAARRRELERLERRVADALGVALATTSTAA